MNKKITISIGVILGILFLILAVVYWITPAASLPAFLPGHEHGVMTKHVKHGIGALMLGLGCFAFAWFQSGKKASEEKKN